MVRIGFWNVDSSARASQNGRDIPAVAAEFALQYSLDVMCLIECALPYEALLKNLTSGPAYYPVPSTDRFRVLCRFDPVYMTRLQPPVSNERYDIWHLTLPLQQELFLTAVHGLDKFHNSEAKQEMFLQQVVSAVSLFEVAHKHSRTVVFGDFNSNPFESPIAGARGMHAVLSKAIARSGSRRFLDQAHEFFYNPMWNLLGDEPASAPPASYYYRGSDPHELFWHMLDQVVIRPSLIDSFNMPSLEIVSRIGGHDLLSAAGVPYAVRYSDHLPIVFELDLSNPAGVGGTDDSEPVA